MFMERPTPSTPAQQPDKPDDPPAEGGEDESSNARIGSVNRSE
jgi:hypothetical protein